MSDHWLYCILFCYVSFSKNISLRGGCMENFALFKIWYELQGGDLDMLPSWKSTVILYKSFEAEMNDNSWNYRRAVQKMKNS
jgi:hypothetical protein